VPAHDGFATCDELRGPDLDGARWSPARLPLPRAATTKTLNRGPHLDQGRSSHVEEWVASTQVPTSRAMPLRV
jgi:hypothetical protein